MEKNSLLMRIAIGICVVAFLIGLYYKFGDDDKSENLSVIVNTTEAIGLFLITFSNFRNKKES